jgi:hypothetical protein
MRYISRIYLHWSDRFLGASPPLVEINLGRILLGKFVTPVEHQAVDLMPIVLKKNLAGSLRSRMALWTFQNK